MERDCGVVMAGRPGCGSEIKPPPPGDGFDSDSGSGRCAYARFLANEGSRVGGHIPRPARTVDGNDRFREYFRVLTGDEPYLWQERLHREWLLQGRTPEGIGLPTGTGKTRLMAIWLLALASGAPLPRRLAWVVDRRVVVDQATREAERLRDALDAPGLAGVRESLCGLSVLGDKGGSPLAISTLRGQFEDNRDWSKDPSRPAIVVGTVDMVGSRILFSGYGDGRWRRPFHAGLLAVDTLVVLDEAQLSTPFEGLMREVARFQWGSESLLPPFRFLPISATLRSGTTFGLAPEEREGGGALSKVLRAPKKIVWHGSLGAPLPPDEFLDKVVGAAEAHEGAGSRVVLYLDRVKDVTAIVRRLEKKAPGRVTVLTGTIRGHERDRLVDDPVFARFLKRTGAEGETVYLVCTSAGEVGVDLYSEHMVCDLVSLERMIQRFGRVNRAGDGDARVDLVVGRQEGGAKRTGLRGPEDAREARRETRDEALLKTEAYLRSLSGVSPAELGRSPPPSDAYSPPPPHPPLRSWLIDAWALTSVAHPDLPVDAWLRGTDTGTPDVYFAWREEIETLGDPSLLDVEEVETILQEYRLLPREILRNSFDAARSFLLSLATGERTATSRVVVVSPSGEAEYRGLLSGLLREDGKSLRVRLPFRTVLLPHTVGGLDDRGMLDDEVTRPARDVSAVPSGEHAASGRGRGHLLEVEEGWEFRPFGEGEPVRAATREEVLREARRQLGLRRVSSFRLGTSAEPELRRELAYLKEERDPGSEADPTEMLLEEHLRRAGEAAEVLTRRLGLPAELSARLVDAARQHDLGKSRSVWQEYARNEDPAHPLAKSARYRAPETLGGYRHELGSLVDLDPGTDPLVRHLVATHHGFGRPHFPDRALDREHLMESRGQRDRHLLAFVGLQREFGWWGLAYLEALVKAADGMASS